MSTNTVVLIVVFIAAALALAAMAVAVTYRFRADRRLLTEESLLAEVRAEIAEDDKDYAARIDAEIEAFRTRRLNDDADRSAGTAAE